MIDWFKFNNCRMTNMIELTFIFIFDWHVIDSGLVKTIQYDAYDDIKLLGSGLRFQGVSQTKERSCWPYSKGILPQNVLTREIWCNEREHWANNKKNGSHRTLPSCEKTSRFLERNDWAATAGKCTNRDSKPHSKNQSWKEREQKITRTFLENVNTASCQAIKVHW